MNKRPIRIGELLVELGRVSPADVERALAHQQAHGGYLGDALVQLGAITRDELRWCLADQHDVPFVHLRPESIDQALAAQVPAAWARQHLVLPVLRSGDTVTVVLEDLAGVETLEEVRRLTGAAAVEPALSSPDDIRALIDAVYGEGSGPPVGVERIVAEALEQGARVVGVSARPGRVLGWYRGEETVFRTLDERWAEELDDLVSPLSPLPGSPVHGLRRWPAILSVAGGSWSVECHALGRGEALEWAAQIGEPIRTDPAAARVEPGAAAAVRLALAAGGLTLHVESDGASVGAELLEAALPALPTLLAGEAARSLHLSDRPAPTPHGVLYLRLREPLDEVLAGLEPFALEALTLCLERVTPEELAAARRVASLVAVHTRADPGAALPVDARFRLRADGGGLLWTHTLPGDGTD